MTRRAVRIVGAIILGLALSATVIDQFTPHSSGTPSSSYATAADGLAGYAELLAQAGHPVRRLRVSPGRARLDPADTLVVLDPDVVLPSDVRALRSFVATGGRLVTGGRAPGAWLSELLQGAPDWAAASSQAFSTLLPVPETAGVRTVQSDGTGSFTNPRATLPVLGHSRDALVTLASLGAGRIVLLADSSPLQNHLLAHADDATLGLAIAGPTRRAVVFDEAVHGYGEARGLAALPDRWKWALLGLLLASLLAVAARFRRLGMGQPPPAVPQPPRRAHVDALGSALARTDRPADAVRPVAERARTLLLSRARLPPDAPDPTILAAAGRFGLSDAEARALVTDAVSETDVLAAGRALAALSGGGQ